jgi:hypothetical protein
MRGWIASWTVFLDFRPSKIFFSFLIKTFPIPGSDEENDYYNARMRGRNANRGRGRMQEEINEDDMQEGTTSEEESDNENEEARKSKEAKDNTQVQKWWILV